MKLIHIIRLLLYVSGILFLCLYTFYRRDGDRNGYYLILAFIFGSAANLIGLFWSD